MITTSDKYKAAVNKSGRHFRLKIDIAGTEYTGIKSFKLKGGTNSSEQITFGDAVSSYIDFILTDVPKNTILKGRQAIPYIGLELDDGTIEWIKKGVYNLEKPVRSGKFIKITAYDNFALCYKGFFTSLSGNQKIATILQEQCKKIGIEFAGGEDDVTYNVDSLQGLTIIEAVSVLAAYCGKNAIMDKDGKLKLAWYTDAGLTISPSRFVDPLEMDEEDTFINRLDCMIDEEHSISAGTGVGIYFSCPRMTQDRLNVLYNRIKGFTYRAAKLNWRMAQPDIEAGDLVRVMDNAGNVYVIPLMDYEFNCDGGFYGTIESKGKTEQEQDTGYKGPLQTKVDRTYSDLISTKQVITDKITAFEGEFETVNTNYININKKLTAVEVETEELKSKTITTEVFNSELSKINTAIIGKADVTDLNTANGKINILESNVADLDTIINRVTTSDSIHSLLINASTAVIDDAYFKSIVSKLITVNDLLATDISTTRFMIKSDSGNLLISDNTIQIKDNARTRVQIGKDANNDYSMAVFDVDGKLIWDARGLKADGIKDAIIRNDMIANDAGIDGKKINISSVVTEINGSTTTINASHILYDGKTLDVGFGSLQTSVSTVSKTVTDNKANWDKAGTALTKATTAETKVTTLTETVSAQNTQIAAQEGKISTLITDTTQTKKDITAVRGDVTTAKGNITTLESNYSSLNQTVNGLNSTVGSHTSSITNINTTANSKAKVFTTTPTTPYKIGDLWVQGGAGVIMKCKVARASGAYVATDWEKADKYTDDSTANKVKTDLTASIKTVTDKQATLEQSLDGFKTSVSSTYSTKTELNTAKSDAISKAATDASNKADQAKAEANANIANLLKSYSTTTQMNSAIDQKADSITQTVSKTYATQSSLTGLTTRVTTAESKLTSSALVTSISSGITGGTALTTTKFTMDKNGFHVKGGGIDIVNNAGTKVLYADTSGNLNMVGNITGGSITSNTRIDVNTDLYVGNNIFLNKNDGVTKKSIVLGKSSINFSSLDEYYQLGIISETDNTNRASISINSGIISSGTATAGISLSLTCKGVSKSLAIDDGTSVRIRNADLWVMNGDVYGTAGFLKCCYENNTPEIVKVNGWIAYKFPSGMMIQTWYSGIYSQTSANVTNGMAYGYAPTPPNYGVPFVGETPATFASGRVAGYNLAFITYPYYSTLTNFSNGVYGYFLFPGFKTSTVKLDANVTLIAIGRWK